MYSRSSGHGQMELHHAQILRGLHKKFDIIDERVTKTAEEGRELAIAACGVYDALIVAGGDGTFTNIVNALAEQENTPILGYINNGTIGDIGHNFGIRPSYRSALKVILKGTPTPFDIMKADGYGYFAYVAGVGQYADIPYITPRKQKKLLGRLAYYNIALKELTQFKKVHAKIVADGIEYEQDVPFVLLLNGKHVGGFLVNDRGNIFDGKMDLYLSKPGIWNGLGQFLFRRHHIKKIVAKDIYIHTDHDMPWCLDGEAGPLGDLHVTCIHNALRIYSLRGPKKSK